MHNKKVAGSNPGRAIKNIGTTLQTKQQLNIVLNFFQ